MNLTPSGGWTARICTGLDGRVSVMSGSKSRFGLASVMVVAGAAHFVMPRFFDRIVPHVLGQPRFFTYASGIAELLCGVLLSVPPTRRFGAWCTVILLILVFPANVQQWIDERSIPTLLRLPLQAPLVAWAYSHTQV